jgi:ketosteroid isomerase-like protein
MTPEEQKDRAREFLEVFEDPDPVKFETMVSSDFEYRVMGSAKGFGHPIRKEGMRGFAGQLKQALPKGLNFRFGPVISEGSHVSLQAESDTEAANGKKYQNRYHFYIRFDGDKIAEVREYCDTDHVREVFGPF